MNEENYSGLSDQKKIENEIERLFVFQDRILGERKRDIFVEEFNECKYPVRAILAGLKELQNQDMRVVKLSEIKGAIRRHIEPEDKKIIDCDDCLGLGIVIMLLGKLDYEYVFGCKCERGRDEARDSKIPLWNGQNEQTVNGKNYRMKYPIDKAPLGLRR